MTFGHLPYPDDRVMASLALLVRCEDEGGTFSYHPDYEYFAANLPSTGRSFRVEFDAFDALVERGWVVADGERVDVTEQGRWQVKRWLRKQGRAGRVA